MTKVVSLFNRDKKSDDIVEKEKVEESNFDFSQIMENNKKKQDKLSKERNQANKSVLRSYRIKN